MEEERKIADYERAAHNEEISKLKGQLEANTVTSNNNMVISKEKPATTAVTPYSNATQQSVSWIGGFFSYFFQSNSMSDGNGMEVLTV